MLIPLTDIKDYLNITNTDYDDFLALQGQIISDAIEGYCNRKFLTDNYIEDIYIEDMSNVLDKSQIELCHFPLIAVDSIKEFPDENFVNGVDVTTYRVHIPTATLTKFRGERFFSNGPVIQIEYSAGYDELPALIKSVFYDLISERYNKKVNGIELGFGQDVQRISIPGAVSVDFDYSLSNNDRKTHFGVILGSQVNILDAFRSERSVIGSVRKKYVT